MTATVVVLTRNEARWIGPCLRSLLAQDGALEILVVDAASTDGTPEAAADAAAGDARVRVLAPGRLLTIGEARNLGVREARGDAVLFLSADAEAAPGWLAAATAALRDADVVYGRQEHAPLVATAGAASRGLRYHAFDRARDPDPVSFASNVNAAYRREVLARLPFPEDRARSALDDVLAARRARAAGYRLAYEPRMVVRHHDVETLRQELTKVRREGYGWGLLRREVGWNVPVLAWGLAAAGAAALLAATRAPWALALLAAVLWAPAARRLLARRARYPAVATAGALAIAPVLDLAFLVEYVRGLLARAPARPPEAASGARTT